MQRLVQGTKQEAENNHLGINCALCGISSYWGVVGRNTLGIATALHGIP